MTYVLTRGVLVLTLLVLAAGSAVAQRFELTIKNQKVYGKRLLFDIYMNNTGDTDLYLGDCDFVLDFNENFFSNYTLSVSVPESGRLAAYTYDALVLESSNDLMVILEAPIVREQTDLEQKIQVLPVGGEELFIGRCEVIEIADGKGSAGLQWAIHRLFKPQVSVFQTAKPYELYFINETGRYTNPVDYPLDDSSVTAVEDEGRSGEAFALEVYPHPAHTEVNVKLNAAAVSTAHVRLISMNGVELLKLNAAVSEQVLRLRLPQWVAAGNYILRVSDAANGRSLGSASIVVQR